jgi:nicotinate phosphoribosyltransferase
MIEHEQRHKDNKGLHTDLYQLKMAAGFEQNQINDKATYELMLRGLPKDYGYYVVNGVEQAIDYILNSQLTRNDIKYLESTGSFSTEQLDALHFMRFNGDIYAIPEGTPVGPNTPILSIVSRRAEAQLAETIALCAIKYPTAVSTKASRIVRAANGIPFADFSLRDMPSPEASIIGTRAAYIGGFAATSNVEAGRVLDIPITGTMAHAWVMKFQVEGEREAFTQYYKSFPDSASFLIDTWDIKMGAKNAALVAKQMEREGHKLVSVRIDSGKLDESSVMIRKLLDSVGLNYVKILATNELDEYKIADLHSAKDEQSSPSDEQSSPSDKLDGGGVGNKIAVAGVADASFKMVEDENGIRMKYSEGKLGIPGRKQVWRQSDEDGKYTHDELALWDEQREGRPLLQLVVKGGQRIKDPRHLKDTRAYSLAEIAKLPEASLAVPYGKGYRTVLTEALENARQEEIAHIKKIITTSDTDDLFEEEQRRYAA